MLETFYFLEQSFSVHKTNRANYIYVMGDGIAQGIHNTMLYAEKCFIETLQTLVKNLC